jgi:predicted  nucleic acid-binding Zn-ribbon protein
LSGASTTRFPGLRTLRANAAPLEVLQRQIETQGTDIAAREALIHAQTEAIDSERRSVEETRARLESERAVLAETGAPAG